MKINTLLAVSICAAIASAALFCGCETESADAAGVTVSPGYSRLYGRGRSVTLTASGWDNFSWDCQPSGIGVLSSRKGKSVVYTATASGIATITATPITGGDSTNSSTSVSSGTATIDHNWDGIEGGQSKIESKKPDQKTNIDPTQVASAK